ncbi:hypothetical protein BD626DRAFT_551464 [Schizophyllum amplum]|uniref:CxC2-like cysteine cluster KDZ transposase-associated domain-containing protein n=1 Tax=Schizophyllum amplum TaxID=97359 RepID=A0A550BVP3_9AGAR|nr:hypothetical protein BD626DRAFT_551464 [Auriculariopsis ampla]
MPVPEESPRKRMRYDTSDYPMQVWLPYRDEYLDEMVRFEGRGSDTYHLHCGTCGTSQGVLYRCRGQECGGGQMFCKTCIVVDHQYCPLHWIEEWKDDHRFERISLKELGLRVQLGHAPGSSCNIPIAANKDFMVIHSNGLHSVAVDFCGCDSLLERRQQTLRAGWFKYWLFIAEDANFRLRNRLVSNDNRDPVLGDGWAYMVKKDVYSEYLKKSVDADEISSCAAFAALFLANMKKNKGLQSTGIGGVCCARHNMYSNMTFILFSALLAVNILTVVLSYDIACQFCKNIGSRMKQLPPDLRLDRKVDLIMVVPNFHLLAHREECHSRFSYHFLTGGANGNGESIEQNWSGMNGIAYQARHMGPGGFRLLIDDTRGHWNWMKIIVLPVVQRRRLWEAIQETASHGSGFKAFRDALLERRPDNVVQWDESIDRWQTDNDQPSPFQVSRHTQTLKDVKLQLAQEERVETASGSETPHDKSPGSLVLLAVQIEDMQLRLRSKVKTADTVTPTQAVEFEHQRTAIVRLINQLRAVQDIHMPLLESKLSDAALQSMSVNGSLQPEDVKVMLPSQISPPALRDTICTPGLVDIEKRVVYAAALDALDDIRHGLRARSATYDFKNKNSVGNKANTRAQSVLREIDLKIHQGAQRYRRHRRAYLALRGGGAWEEELKELKDTDIRFLNERDQEDQLRRQGLLLTLAPASVPLQGAVAAGEGRRTLSWIWLHSNPDSETASDTVVEALGVEYCRAKARARRWHEEIILLEEEMRRALVYCTWMSTSWEARASQRTTPMTSALTEGLRAYAFDQSHMWKKMEERMEGMWAQSRKVAAAHLRTMDAEGNVIGELTLDEMHTRDIGQDIGDTEETWMYDV